VIGPGTEVGTLTGTGTDIGGIMGSDAGAGELSTGNTAGSE